MTKADRLLVEGLWDEAACRKVFLCYASLQTAKAMWVPVLSL